MTEDNINLHLSEENQKKQLFLKKIKLSDFPELQKNYNDFFNNRNHYFNNKYKNNDIIIGKIKDSKEKEDLMPKFKSLKSKNKKYLFNSPKMSNSRITPDDSSHGDKKRIGAKIIKDTSLKVGQQYISENELEDLFNKFKNVQKINKSTIKDFITVKDLIEKKIKIKPFNKNFKIEKIFTPIKNENSIFGENSIPFHKTENNEYNRTISTCISNPNLRNEHLNDSNSAKNVFANNNLNPGYSSYNNIKTYKKEMNYFKTLNNFYEYKKNNNNKNIKSRNKIIARQNQFLSNTKDTNYYKNKSEQKYFAELLANQEKTLLKSSKSQTKMENMTKKISNTINKRKKDLLLLNVDSYRIKSELLHKFENLNKCLKREHFYNWYDELRTISNSNINNQNFYNIRDPLKNPENQKNFNLSKNIKFKNLKKLVNDINRISRNFEGLIVKGENLLQLEYDFVKTLKNKKIINNIEAYLPSIEVEDKCFVNKNQFSK